MSMILNPFRFAAAPAWVQRMLLSGGATENSFTNYTTVSAITRHILGPGYPKFRLSFTHLAGTGVDASYSKVYIGEGQNGTLLASPTQVFFGGSASVDIPAGATVVSDEITFNYTGAKSLIIKGHISNAAKNRQTRYSVGAFGTFAEYISGDSAATGTYIVPTAIGTYMLVKVETLGVSSTWQEYYKITGNQDNNSGWANFTLRCRMEASIFTRNAASLRAIVRSATKCYIGYAQAAAGSMQFDGTPTQMLFGGAAGSPSFVDCLNVTDGTPFAYDRSKPLLFSMHTNNNVICRGAAQTGVKSQYLSGDTADSTAAWSGSEYVPNLALGLVALDVAA